MAIALWKQPSIKALRSLIDDLDEDAYTYTDDRLLSLLIICGAQNAMEINFGVDYVVGICDISIAPEPTSQFIILMVLRTVCLVREGEYKTAASSAILFKDGPSSIDSRESATHAKGLVDRAWENFEKAKLSFMFGDGSVGQAIVGPYSVGLVDSGIMFN